MTVSIKNSANGEWKTNTFIKKKLQSMIMVTFTKLFVIRIVANKRSESSRRKLIFSSAGCLRSSISFLSEGESEKKAISEAEAKPGDLVFFEGTYDTPGKSHVGIYLGNGKMVSAGDPIKYADIHSSYWQKYLSGFGRLSK